MLTSNETKKNNKHIIEKKSKQRVDENFFAFAFLTGGILTTATKPRPICSDEGRAFFKDRKVFSIAIIFLQLYCSSLCSLYIRNKFNKL